MFSTRPFPVTFCHFAQHCLCTAHTFLQLLQEPKSQQTAPSTPGNYLIPSLFPVTLSISYQVETRGVSSLHHFLLASSLVCLLLCTPGMDLLYQMPTISQRGTTALCRVLFYQVGTTVSIYVLPIVYKGLTNNSSTGALPTARSRTLAYAFSAYYLLSTKMGSLASSLFFSGFSRLRPVKAFPSFIRGSVWGGWGGGGQKED